MEHPEHWHAYTWTGYALPERGTCRSPFTFCPPLVTSQWLLKPRAMMAATFRTPPQCLAWLIRRLDAQPPLGTQPDNTRLMSALERMTEHPGDAVLSYWTPSGRLVSHTLVSCPKPGLPCPDTILPGRAA